MSDSLWTIVCHLTHPRPCSLWCICCLTSTTCASGHGWKIYKGHIALALVVGLCITMISKSALPILSLCCFSLCALAAPASLVKRADPQGIDVSHYQGTIDWSTVKANGISFVFIKATEGTSKFHASVWILLMIVVRLHWSGLFRQLYRSDERWSHSRWISFCEARFILRGCSSELFLGKRWSAFSFQSHSQIVIIYPGGWSADGITLPGALDIECKHASLVKLPSLRCNIDNDDGAECYGLSASAMVSWIQDFSNTYHASTTR